MSFPILPIVGRGLDIAFAHVAQLLVSVTFYRITGYTLAADGASSAVIASATASVLAVDYRTQEVREDIRYGDKRLLVQASKLGSLAPVAGDWVVMNGERWDIQQSLLDATRQLYTFQVRRVIPVITDPVSPGIPPEDWGPIVFGSGWNSITIEDWGSVASRATVLEDWMS